MPPATPRDAGRPRTKGGGPGKAGRRCVVVGIGNPFMRDDGVGIELARSLRKLRLGPNVLILERQALDISVLDDAEGASKLVIVDAVKSERPAGSVVKFRAGGPGSPALRAPMSHEQSLHDILALARKIGKRPPPVVVVGIEPADCAAGEGFSEQVAGAIPRALREVRDEVAECAVRSVGEPG